MTIELTDRVVLTDRIEMADSGELTLDDLFERLEQMPVPEGYKVEIVKGAVFMSPQRKLHWDTISAVYEQLRTRYARKRLASDVRFDFPGLNGLCPDLVALKEDAKADDKGRCKPEDMEFVLEVISRSTAANDYGDKKAVYAEAEVPVYLIVDPYTGRCHLHTHPKGGEYLSELKVAFGEPIDLTGTVVKLTLTTDEFSRD
ncbi:Uma2 family endonuclease [Streptomyces cuspidosporus]|uniref:Uma2 family endonuclease n=2 Tax=Streptomyces cuspidosporus TaxID=66882 RepID=A0ABN3GJR0_9ACTN